MKKLQQYLKEHTELTEKHVQKFKELIKFIENVSKIHETNMVIAQQEMIAKTAIELKKSFGDLRNKK
uniref:Uncharacterized protein n=1 Tax=Cavenderia fasciculata TaxID=261658 RepID=B2XX71_CACFS|nr:hypothetical protein Difao_mp09 [Cavenderia fasciculata]ABX45193.1 hypothetical protein [Cavenderia fasciculata]